jgi:hypothetical protein
LSINLAGTTSRKAPKIKVLGLVRIILVTLNAEKIFSAFLFESMDFSEKCDIIYVLYIIRRKGGKKCAQKQENT